MSATEKEPSKLEVFAAFYSYGWVVVHLDPRHPGVVVPERFRDGAHLVLQYGEGMPIPIHDLVVDENGISATLSFDKVLHATFVPWSAIFILADTNGGGIFFEKDAPADLNRRVVLAGEGPEWEDEKTSPDIRAVGDDEVPEEPGEPPVRRSWTPEIVR